MTIAYIYDAGVPRHLVVTDHVDARPADILQRFGGNRPEIYDWIALQNTAMLKHEYQEHTRHLLCPFRSLMSALNTTAKHSVLQNPSHEYLGDSKAMSSIGNSALTIWRLSETMTEFPICTA
jgi:hypothetical protein